MYTPLHAACANGQINVVRLLLDYGVEVDAVSAQGNTSLHVACLNGQDMVASELIAHGASVNARNHKGQVNLVTDELREGFRNSS
jgi:serine/threonine-protein phosphatase 6 regulatory ankyrin repeat subunit A